MTSAWTDHAWTTCLESFPNLHIFNINSPLLLALDDHDELLQTIDKWGKCIPSLRWIYIQDTYNDHEEYEDLNVGTQYYGGRVVSFDFDPVANRWKDLSYSVLGFPGCGSVKGPPYYKKTSEEHKDVLDTDSE